MASAPDPIAKILGSRAADESVRAWLQRLNAALSAESTLRPATVAALVSRGRPRWGTRTSDDAAAYVAFWADLTVRHDTPALRAAYADVLLLLGPRERAREALEVFLAAARRDPEVFIAYCGDFVDLATELGARRDYELTKLAFYAYLADKGDLDDAELRDAVREVLAEFGDDPTVRSALHVIANGSLTRIAGLR